MNLITNVPHLGITLGSQYQQPQKMAELGPYSPSSNRLEYPQALPLASCSKIQYLSKRSMWFNTVPDVGMDRFLVTDGSPIGTGGVGPCFVVCLIGKTKGNAPVLGLCHKSSILPFEDVHDFVKEEMVDQWSADESSITTYVVGGQPPSLMVPEGTLEEERDILALAAAKKVAGVLFNKTSADNEDEGLNVVLTPEKIYVSMEPLFPVTGKDAGERFF
jgi:hypothetical protein